MRARWYIQIGEKEKALRDLEKYTDLVNDPFIAAQAYDMTWRSVHKKHQEIIAPEIVVELYHKAHKLQPKNWKYLCGLGVAYYRTGQWIETIDNLTKSTKLDGGENVCNHLYLAMVNWRLDKKKEAKNFYNKAIEWIENNKNSWLYEYDTVIFEIFIETADTLGIELNDLFTKGVLQMCN